MNCKIAPPQVIYELGQRQNQEDALFPPFGQATDADPLFLVCDGMGGHDHGEVASQTVAETIGHFISDRLTANAPLPDSLLADAIAEAYNQLDTRDNPADLKKMGTTLTLLCLHRGGATMAHIGDSRIYHIRPNSSPNGGGREGALLYQSRDHSLVMDLYLSGELTRDEIDTYEGKNIITRAMQPHQERRSRPDIVHTTDLRPGDLFLLCSDGIVEQLTDNHLLSILCAGLPDERILQRLRAATASAADNHTAYLIRILAVEQEPSDATAPDDEATSRANLINIIRVREAENEQPKAAGNNTRGWLHNLLHKIMTL
ncbi:MAG: serine/threonine-protein phosphatase [Bacteroidaceae bacterium]|nr:serine/threonine-protein phosphatase [Bacteroidaceae bacterium]